MSVNKFQAIVFLCWPGPPTFKMVPPPMRLIECPGVLASPSLICTPFLAPMADGDDNPIQTVLYEHKSVNQKTSLKQLLTVVSNIGINIRKLIGGLSKLLCGFLYSQT